MLPAAYVPATPAFHAARTHAHHATVNAIRPVPSRSLVRGHAPSWEGNGVGCLDNAALESFFASLKKEHAHKACFRTRGEAKAAVFDHTEAFHDRQRLRSGAGHRTPAETRADMMSEVAMAIAT